MPSLDTAVGMELGGWKYSPIGKAHSTAAGAGARRALFYSVAFHYCPRLKRAGQSGRRVQSKRLLKGHGVKIPEQVESDNQAIIAHGFVGSSLGNELEM